VPEVLCYQQIVLTQTEHSQPPAATNSRYSKSITNCAIVAPFVDRLYVLDNSVDNADAQLLFRAVAGFLAKQYVPVNPWAEVIYQSVNRR
jgi:hypothetical protein